jgi:hypothetical protein
MTSLKDRQLAAITSVAKHFGGTVSQDANERGTLLVIGRKRIPVSVAVIEPRVPKAPRLKPPRLRFDRGVLRLLERLRTALQDEVPAGVTVALTVTAPIRQPAKTATAVADRIRTLLGKRSKQAELTKAINANQIQIRLMRAGKGATSKLAGFVHNRDSDPTILFDLTHALLERTRKTLSAAGEHWLVLAIEDDPTWMDTYQHVCAQLFAQTGMRRVILVGPNGALTPAQAVLP